MRGFDILVSETRSCTIYDLESETRDRASHSQAGSPKPAPRHASRWTAWGLAWTPPYPVLGAGADRCGRGARRAAPPVTGSRSLRYPGSLRARAAAHSHSPDGAHLRTSCPVLASGGLRSAHRRSETGRRWVAGTGAVRRRMITRRGQGQPRDLAGALCRHGYPHVHSPARPHMHRGLTSVFTQIIHRPIHRALPLAGQRAAGEHESREKAVIPRYTFPPGGREMTFTRIAC